MSTRHSIAAGLRKPKVLLTNPIHPELMPTLQAQCEVTVAPDSSAATLRALAADAEGLMVRAQLPDDFFDFAPRLRTVVRHGVGLDMIPVVAATARGIAVANLPGSNTSAVVEYCLAAMLHFRRNLGAIDSLLRSEGWQSARALADDGSEVGQTVCGIVGVGAVGARLAAICSSLGMSVIGLTRRPASLPAGVSPVDKDELFRRADVVVLCCPLNEQTRGLADAAAIALMKPDAILINVSRGPVLDTAAALDALRVGRLGGAAMDVHDRQPLSGDEPVLKSPRLLLTPHIAGITATSMRRMSEGAVATLLAMLKGEQPGNIVNPEVFHRP